MPHIRINTPIIKTLPNLSKHIQCLAGILHPRLMALLLPRRTEAHHAQRILSNDDRQPLRGDCASRVLVQRLLKEFGRIHKFLAAVADRFRRGVADFPREMVVQPRGGAVRVDVPLAKFFQGGEDEVEGRFEEVGLEEEVGVVGSEI
jgi:hypothetical protein